MKKNSRGKDFPVDFFASLDNSIGIPDILDQVSDGIYITDTERQILFWNRAAETITGYKQEEVLGRKCADGILEHIDMAGNKLCSSDLCPLYRAMNSGMATPSPLKVKAKHRDGGRVVVEVTVSPLSCADGTVIGGIEIFRDISEKVELDEQKARFFSSLSHELKTPLSNMRGYLELLLAGDAGALNETQEEFVTTISSEENKLAGVIDELLEMGRFESTDFTYERSLINLSELLTNLIRSFSAEAKKKKLVFNHTVPPDLTVAGDRDRLAQAFGNLISNAIKYTEQGSVELSADYLAADGQVSVIISDSGIGIAENEQEAIFEMFYRVENPGTRSQGGTGVGLYIVERIINRHDGRVTVKSAPGKGSVFRVTLPGTAGGEGVSSQ